MQGAPHTLHKRDNIPLKQQAFSMQIVPWGVRGSVPVTNPAMQKYGGNTTCFEIRHAGTEHIIIDAGTGIHALGQQLPPAGEAHILITHTHLDHIQGLPFFAPLHNPDWKIHFYAPTGNIDFLHSLFNGKLFPLTPAQLHCQWDVQELHEGTTLHLSDIAIRTALVPHTSLCHAFVISDAERVNAIIPDAEIYDDVSKAHIQNILQDCDLAFIDGHYTQDEYLRHKGWGHSSQQVLLQVATQAQVARIGIFHHAPFRTDAALDILLQQMQKSFIGSSVQIFMAAEGTAY